MNGTGRSSVHGVRDQRQRADLAIARTAESATLTTISVIGATLAMAWGITYLWGGTKTVGPQLFYAPVLIAATRFGHLGALVTAVAAGLLCGPLVPFDVDLGQEQSVSNWVIRMVFFVVIGQVVAALHLRSLPVVQERLEHRHFRQRLAAALHAGEIRPVFQPVVELSSGRIIGVEALARWRSPDADVVMPSEFIPNAEAAGVVTDIDIEILRRSAAQLASWAEAGLVDLDDFVLTVNFSGSGFDDPHLADRVRAVLDQTGIEPVSVVIEVTETALIVDLARAAARMHDLKEVGVGLALDDFGVGQSSLAALHQYPIDVVKLDRTFLDLDELERPELLAAIVNLAFGLSRQMVIAEGIETAGQFRKVLAAGCVHGQGFLFDQPLDAEGIERALDAGAYHLPIAADGEAQVSEAI
jgi:diguanylate cyclase